MASPEQLRSSRRENPKSGTSPDRQRGGRSCRARGTLARGREHSWRRLSDDPMHIRTLEGTLTPLHARSRPREETLDMPGRSDGSCQSTKGVRRVCACAVDDDLHQTFCGHGGRKNPCEINLATPTGDGMLSAARLKRRAGGRGTGISTKGSQALAWGGRSDP